MHQHQVRVLPANRPSAPPAPRFPETQHLHLGQTLSSGHGSVSFDSDRDCTDFVHSYFPSCKTYLSSCGEVGRVDGGRWMD